MKKNKRFILTLICAIALVIGSIAGTMAYMTSTDKADNTFTAGGVDIDLIEQQRNDDGTALEDFENDKVLLPIVGSAQGEKDDFGMPIAANYVDKIVTIKNTGKSDAYIRAFYAVPSDLDDGLVEGFNAGMNILHGNFGNFMGDDGDWHTTFMNQWIWKHENAEGAKIWNYFETEIEGVKYNVYFTDYHKIVEPEETTEQFIMGVYLDKNVDMKDGHYIDPRHPNADLSILEGTVHYPIYAIAVQAAGFDSADAAVTAAFGAHFNPWNTPVENWQ